jgi:aminoglycoside phosphotransferase (APT) family kinase protein
MTDNARARPDRPDRRNRSDSPESVDQDVSDWLASRGLPPGAIAHTRRLAGGHRNHNTVLVTDTGDRYVLRRYQHEDRAAVEAALANRLAGLVPVAEVVAVGRGERTGEPLLLSRFVPGTLVSDLLPGMSGQEAARLGRAVGRVLAGIGTVSFAGPGFFAGPELEPAPGPAGTGDLPAFVDRCLRAAAPSAVLTPGESDAVRRLASTSVPLLAQDPVANASELVHADFNPKNLLANAARAAGRSPRCSTGSSPSAAARCSTSGTCCASRRSIRPAS